VLYNPSTQRVITYTPVIPLCTHCNGDNTPRKIRATFSGLSTCAGCLFTSGNDWTFENTGFNGIVDLTWKYQGSGVGTPCIWEGEIAANATANEWKTFPPGCETLINTFTKVTVLFALSSSGAASLTARWHGIDLNFIFFYKSGIPIISKCTECTSSNYCVCGGPSINGAYFPNPAEGGIAVLEEIGW